MKLRDVVPAVLPGIGPGDCGDWSPSSVLIAPQSAGASFVKVSDQSIFFSACFLLGTVYICVCNMHL